MIFKYVIFSGKKEQTLNNVLQFLIILLVNSRKLKISV